MVDMKVWAALSIIAALLLGGLAGAMLYPKEVVVEKEVPVEVQVPVNVTVEKEVIVEVLVEDTEKLDALQADYTALKTRYEQLTSEDLDSAELRRELAAISKAVIEFKEDYKHLVLDGYKPSEVRVIKVFSQDVTLEEVERVVDGRLVEYEQAEVSFTIKVEYKDAEGVAYQWWDVVVSYDLDSDGVEESDVSVSSA